MLSPAPSPSPSPSPARSGKKMHHFSLLFSPKILKDREIMLFQNRKNKILSGPKILRERIQNAPFFCSAPRRKSRLGRASVEQSVKTARFVVLFFEKAPRVGFEPTRDFGCPFPGLRCLTTRPQPRLRVKGVQIAVMCGRTLFLMMFFACFLIHCKTGVFIFSPSIFDEKA